MSDLNQIYDALLRIERGQGEARADINNLASALKKHVEDDDKVEERVATLEKRGAKLYGMAAAASAIMSIIFTAGVEILKGHR